MAVSIPSLPDAPRAFHLLALKHERAPVDVMLLYAEEDARRGRNNPCTCGSGGKRKYWHGSTTP